jgi:hypothetical protein
MEILHLVDMDSYIIEFYLVHPYYSRALYGLFFLIRDYQLLAYLIGFTCPDLTKLSNEYSVCTRKHLHVPKNI